MRFLPGRGRSPAEEPFDLTIEAVAERLNPVNPDYVIGSGLAGVGYREVRCEAAGAGLPFTDAEYYSPDRSLATLGIKGIRPGWAIRVQESVSPQFSSTSIDSRFSAATIGAVSWPYKVSISPRDHELVSWVEDGLDRGSVIKKGLGHLHRAALKTGHSTEFVPLDSHNYKFDSPTVIATALMKHRMTRTIAERTLQNMLAEEWDRRLSICCIEPTMHLESPQDRR